MRRRAWAPIPTGWIQGDTIKEEFQWKPSQPTVGATAIASLQLWVALATHADSDDASDLKSGTPCSREVAITYTKLMEATGLSRKLISAGLQHLKDIGMIESEKIGRANHYQVNGYQKGKWCKFPERSIYVKDRIPGFHIFHKRAVLELHALKIFLYLASARRNNESFTCVPFSFIQEHTGVTENSITRANALLLNAGFITNIVQDKAEGKSGNAP